MNYDIPIETHKRAKRAALELDITLKQFVIDALSEKADRVERQAWRPASRPRKKS